MSKIFTHTCGKCNKVSTDCFFRKMILNHTIYITDAPVEAQKASSRTGQFLYLRARCKSGCWSWRQAVKSVGIWTVPRWRKEQNSLLHVSPSRKDIRSTPFFWTCKNVKMKGISNLIRFHFRLDVKVRRKLTTKDEYSSLPGARCENMILFAIFVLLPFTTY